MPHSWTGRALLVAVALTLAGVVWFALQVDPIFSSPGRQVIVTVNPGDSLATIAGELHAAGVIASPLAFRVEDVVLGPRLVRSGSYGLRQRSSFAAVRSILSHPPNVVVVSPGLTLHEVALDVEGIRGARFADAFAAAASDVVTRSPFAAGTSLEGLIGTGQYVIGPTTTARGLVRVMIRRFNALAASVSLTPSTTVNGLNAYQLIVAASIVEKEGYYVRNMPKVARVIFNRLARGGPLQMDATVLYSFGRDGGTVTHAMENTPTPYNTYLNTGLTPTPICTVSKSALESVLHAPTGPWLYFTVINRRGDEAFATTFAQQLANEAAATASGAP